MGEITMEPITTAIIAAVSTKMAQTVVVDSYNKLKSLIKSKFGDTNDLSLAIDKYEEKKSDAWRDEIDGEDKAIKAQGDDELIKLAKEIYKKIQETPEGQKVISKYNLTIKDSKIGVVGDHTVINGDLNL